MARKEKNRARDRKYHYTYLIRDIKNKKVYYGVHSTDFDPYSIEDYYSSSKHLKLIIEKEGFGNFKKEVRRFFKTRVLADEWEAKVLNRINAKDHKDFYNKSNGDSGFTASGYVSVRLKENENKVIRVPVDDPYIGILYDHSSLGRKMPDDEKERLSRLYKGTREGKNNPVHKIKDKVSWAKNVSKGNTGKELPTHVLERLKSPEHWEHLKSCKIKKEIQEHMNFCSSINNAKFKGFWLYKGEIYLHNHKLPVDVNNGAAWYVEEPHPLVEVLQAGDRRYSSVKSASEGLGCHINTVRNRINNPSEVWVDYFWLTKDEVRKLKSESEKDFKTHIKEKYAKRIEENSKYVKPFSLGISDEDFTKECMETGAYLQGTTFKRLNVKDSQGNYSRYEMTCPICSNDRYVEVGVCTGKFQGIGSLVRKGSAPCRCGDKKMHKIEIYLYEIEQLCKKEGLTYLGVNGSVRGTSETKVKCFCRKGNLIETSRVNMFLSGSRCVCCNRENTKLDIPCINLLEEFQFRKELYKEKTQ